MSYRAAWPSKMLAIATIAVIGSLAREAAAQPAAAASSGTGGFNNYRRSAPGTTAPSPGTPGYLRCWANILEGQRLATRPECEREVQRSRNPATTLNLGHTYLLTGDKEGAYLWYRESVGLIKFEFELQEPLADFRGFIERGWAVSLSQEALAWFEQSYSLLSRATVLNHQVAMSYRDARYREAEAPAMEVLATRERVLGPEHPLVSEALNNLAILLEAMGRYEQALPLYQRALAISEKTQGREHPSTGTRLNNLAVLLQRMARYEQALPLFERALTISAKAHGPEHSTTGTRLNNLADLYRAMGRYEQALPLYERALAISEALGPEHPSTGTSLSSLAELYRSMARYEEALPLFERALAISEETEGPEHPNTGTRLNNLAGLYRAMGRYQEALPLYERSLAIGEKTDGPEHSNTGTRLNNLAVLYEALDLYELALPHYERALAISEKAADPEFSWTLQSNMMDLYSRRRAEAPALYQPQLAVWYGKQAVNSLQSIRSRLKDLDKDLQGSFLRKNESTYQNLANLLIESGRIVEAEQVLAMLKEQEVFELTRNPLAKASETRVDCVGVECRAQAEQRRLMTTVDIKESAELAALERERQALLQTNQALSQAKEARYQTMLKSAESWRAEHQRFISALSKMFAEAARTAVSEHADTRTSRLGEMVALDPAGAVGLHYVVSDDRVGIIVATPSGSFGRFSAVKRADLNRQVSALRQAMVSRADTRSAAQALWKVLIEPVLPDLKATGAKTLVLSLTDTLRYVPFSSLQDGVSRVGVIRPPGVGIYRPLEEASRGISKHSVDGRYFAALAGGFGVLFFDAGATFGSR